MTASHKDKLRNLGWIEYCGCAVCRKIEIANPEPNSTDNINDVLRSLPSEASLRKALPITTGVVDYFPLALAEIARISLAGQRQHAPDQPLHWERTKSANHADCIARHLIGRGEIDTDGERHTAKLAWRALALLQEEIEQVAGFSPGASTK